MDMLFRGYSKYFLKLALWRTKEVLSMPTFSLFRSCPESVITFQPVAVAGRSSDRWLR